MSKIEELTDQQGFKAKVQATVAVMLARGESPKVYEALRTVEQQREKVAKGYSKTMRSAHLPGKDGKARAADIACAQKGWDATRRFWLMLASNALARGMEWGGLYGLNSRQRRAVVSAITALRSVGWPNDHEAYSVKIGWDPAHVQTGNNWPSV